MFYIKRMQSNCDFGFAIQKTTSSFAIQNYENDKLLLKTICLRAIEINGFQEVEKKREKYLFNLFVVPRGVIMKLLFRLK